MIVRFEMKYVLMWFVIDYLCVMDRLSVTDILERFGRRMVFVGNIHSWNEHMGVAG